MNGVLRPVDRRKSQELVRGRHTVVERQVEEARTGRALRCQWIRRYHEDMRAFELGFQEFHGIADLSLHYVYILVKNCIGFCFISIDLSFCTVNIHISYAYILGPKTSSRAGRPCVYDQSIRTLPSQCGSRSSRRKVQYLPVSCPRPLNTWLTWCCSVKS